MLKAKVNRAELTIRGKKYAQGALVDVEDGQEYQNLLRSGKLVAHDIDAKLAQSGKTLDEQLAVNLAEAQGVMSGPHVASAPAPKEEEPAKKLPAKSAPKKTSK